MEDDCAGAAQQAKDEKESGKNNPVCLFIRGADRRAQVSHDVANEEKIAETQRASKEGFAISGLSAFQQCLSLVFCENIGRNEIAFDGVLEKENRQDDQTEKNVSPQRHRVAWGVEGESLARFAEDDDAREG